MWIYIRYVESIILMFVELQAASRKIQRIFY